MSKKIDPETQMAKGLSAVVEKAINSNISAEQICQQLKLFTAVTCSYLKMKPKKNTYIGIAAVHVGTELSRASDLGAQEPGL